MKSRRILSLLTFALVATMAATVIARSPSLSGLYSSSNGLQLASNPSFTGSYSSDFVDRHNEIRRSAGVTNDLTWDSKLAGIASTFANQCPIDFNLFRSSSYGGAVGENVLWISASNVSSPADAIAYWSQRSGFNNGSDYNQIVWSRTQRIGCGYSQCQMQDSEQSLLIVVCNYYPAGSILNEAPFLSNNGQLCVPACGANAFCNSGVCQCIDGFAMDSVGICQPISSTSNLLNTWSSWTPISDAYGSSAVWSLVGDELQLTAGLPDSAYHRVMRNIPVQSDQAGRYMSLWVGGLTPAIGYSSFLLGTRFDRSTGAALELEILPSATALGTADVRVCLQTSFNRRGCFNFDDSQGFAFCNASWSSVGYNRVTLRSIQRSSGDVVLAASVNGIQCTPVIIAAKYMSYFGSSSADDASLVFIGARGTGMKQFAKFEALPIASDDYSACAIGGTLGAVAAIPLAAGAGNSDGSSSSSGLGTGGIIALAVAIPVGVGGGLIGLLLILALIGLLIAGVVAFARNRGAIAAPVEMGMPYSNVAVPATVVGTAAAVPVAVAAVPAAAAVSTLPGTGSAAVGVPASAVAVPAAAATGSAFANGANGSGYYAPAGAAMGGSGLVADGSRMDTGSRIVPISGDYPTDTY